MEINELKKIGDGLKDENAPLEKWLEHGLVPVEHVSNIAMVAGNEKKISCVRYASGKTMEWVGIGWVEITEDENALLIY